MGQAFGTGIAAGITVSTIATPLQMSLANHIALASAFAGMGLSVDFASDAFAKEGKTVIQRDVVLNATDVLRHVSTYYTTCNTNPLSRLCRQKHEWLLLESHSNRYYVVQKNPVNGNLQMDMRLSVRAANDLGLAVAGQPTLTGETRQKRADYEFDLPNDLQVAYVVAWLRKEDARWAFSTENSRHFTAKLRAALNDF